ncbi:hypothetical protein, partial [Geitlerinema sp. P-1104]|uniref:hypothetical protein n=1 Tax=Geitlerinema sp. P-1104 TaxID=2546230 RepID=UPI0025707923
LILLPEVFFSSLAERTVRNVRANVLGVRLEAGLVCVTCGLILSQVSTDTPISPKAGGVSFIQTRFYKEAFLEGWEKGWQEGLEEARQEFRQEERRLLIRRMRDRNHSLEDIAQLLDVSVEEVQRLLT